LEWLRIEAQIAVAKIWDTAFACALKQEMEATLDELLDSPQDMTRIIVGMALEAEATTKTLKTPRLSSAPITPFKVLVSPDFYDPFVAPCYKIVEKNDVDVYIMLRFTANQRDKKTLTARISILKTACEKDFDAYPDLPLKLSQRY
jgi:hypothetical protein